MRDLRVTVDGRRVVITPHALTRYMERGSRHEDEGPVVAELDALVRACGRLGPVPAWRAEREALTLEAEQRGFPRDEVTQWGTVWLLLGDDVGFPVVEDAGTLVARTCLVRAAISPATRERRRKGRQEARAARRAVRAAEARGKWVGGRWVAYR